MIYTQTSTGVVFAGEKEVVVRPIRTAVTKPPVIYVHGAEGDVGGGLTWMKIKSRAPLIHALANDGRMLLSADLGGVATWGNDIAMSRLTAAYNVTQSLTDDMSGKVVLVGQSMGGLNAMLWARANPTLVHSVVSVIPVVNLTDIHNNRGLGASIDSAYGGSYSEAVYGATKNPSTIAQAGGYNTVRTLLYYGDTDILCLPEFAEAFANNSALTQAVAVDGGHSEEAVGLVPASDVIRFINE